MQAIWDAINNTILNMQAVGWQHWPLFITISVMVGARLFFEDDILEVNTTEAKHTQVKIKRRVALASYVVSIIACFAFDFPKTIEEALQAFMFSILNVIIGYASYSVYQMIDVKGRLKGAINAKLSGGTPPDTTPKP